MAKKSKEDRTEEKELELREKIKEYQDYISGSLQELQASKIPVIVLVEGYAAGGKGSLINELISEIDPRFCSVFNYETVPIDTGVYPYLYVFFRSLPENGKYVFMDSGWMEEAVRRYINGDWDKKTYETNTKSAELFERQLKNNGYVVIKFFVDLDEDTQRERFRQLQKDPSTEWRVDEYDLRQSARFDQYTYLYKDFMEKTSESFKWHKLDGRDATGMRHEAFRIIAETLREAVKDGKYDGKPYKESFPMVAMPLLKDVSLEGKVLDKDEYKKELKRLQKSIGKLQYKIFQKKIPVIIAYEGWDAAGKGGNIKRLAYPLDPRGMKVHPIGSPEPHEKARHHLYRFYCRLPENGTFAIFDRTWYGKVMVERIEGFCTENEWKRGYNEINEFERDMVNWGALVLKFWIQIDSDTQLKRFEDRQNTPEKQWKITDEDWRNREKWDEYEVAVNEMLKKTSTTFAPWYIIESVDKNYARIKVLSIVERELKRVLKER